jgi:hypothetical protein
MIKTSQLHEAVLEKIKTNPEFISEITKLIANNSPPHVRAILSNSTSWPLMCESEDINIWMINMPTSSLVTLFPQDAIEYAKKIHGMTGFKKVRFVLKLPTFSRYWIVEFNGFLVQIREEK